MKTSTSKYYTGRMKMADMLLCDVTLLPILERLGIRLGFGEATISEICSRYRLSENLFLAICNIYSLGSSPLRTEDLDVDDLPRIVSYLRSSHEYYNSVCFPRIGQSIAQTTEHCSELNRNLMSRFFEDYRNEVGRHFRYEEQTVFPYIESLIRGCSPADYRIEQFRRNHSDIDEKLSDLKNIIIKYLPEDCSGEARNDSVIEIFRLEHDLERHTQIENDMLIPLVAKIENNEK